MTNETFIPDHKIDKLAKKISKNFSLSQEEAMEIIYEEWEQVENLFHAHTKVKEVHYHLCEEINYTYRIA